MYIKELKVLEVSNMSRYQEKVSMQFAVDWVGTAVSNEVLLLFLNKIFSLATLACILIPVVIQIKCLL